MKHWALFILGLAYAVIAFPKASIEEMERRLPETSGKERVQLLIDLSFEYKFSLNEKALEYAHQALTLAQQFNDPLLLAAAHNRVGNTHRLGDTPDSALVHTLTALNLSEEVGDIPLMGTFLNSIGLIYMELQDYDQALSYLEQSILIRSNLGETFLGDVAKSKHNLGSVHYHIQQYDEALMYYNEALDRKRRIANPSLRSQALTMDKLGLTHMALGNYISADSFFTEVLKIRRNINFKAGVIICLFHLGELSTLQKHYQKALGYYQEALQMIDSNEDFELYRGELFYLSGSVYQLMGDFETAKKSLQQSLGFSRINVDNKLLQQTHMKLAEIYASEKQFEKAWYNMQQYAKLSDSTSHNRLAKKIAKAQVAYENAQKDELIRKLNAKEKQDNYLFSALLLSLLLLLALILAIYTRFRSRQKLTRELSRQNTLLKQSNEELERFAYIASHDLKEPLRMISGFVQLLNRRYASKLDEDGREYIGFVISGVERIYQLLDDLLAYSRINHQGKQNQKPVDVRQILHQVLANLEAQIQDSSAVVKLPANLPIIQHHKVLITQVFQNLINNAIKFRREEIPQISIEYHLSRGFHHFVIKDNGMGIPKKYHDKVFTLFQRLHNQEQIEGTGIGLAICKKIIEQNGGKIWIVSQVEKGTDIHFTIPEHPVL